MLLLLACAQQPPVEVASPAASARPNLVLVSIDTLRADRMSLYGYERPTTPELEALAEGARVFERASSPAPWTLPSVTSTLTGLLPAEHGVVDRSLELAPEVQTLAEALGELGYETALFGVNAVFETGHGLDQGFETWRPHKGTSGGQLNVEVREFLARRDEERPLFLVVHYFEPHCPYQAPRSLRGLWLPEGGEPEDLDAAVFEALGDCYRVQQDGEAVRDQRVIRARYDQEVLVTDRLVGELWRMVEPLDPVLGLSADHGEAFWEHGVHGHGEQLFQEQTHVPMLLRAPGVAPERVGVPTSTVWLSQALLASGAGEDLPPYGQPVFTSTDYGSAPSRAVIVNDLEVIREMTSGEDRLYDLASDPGERSPQAPDPQLSGLLDALGLQAPIHPAVPRDQTEPEREGLRALGYLE